MKVIKKFIENIPLIGPMIKGIAIAASRPFFSGSQKYWESRYAGGKTSGAGSCRKLAEFKAEFLNTFIKEHHVDSVMEFGCGDGNQLTLAKYPCYVGLDVSKTAVEMCKKRFNGDNTKSFFLYEPDCFVDKHSVFRAELVLSLDVIYHLVEDVVFELYMKHLFSAGSKFVIIYSTDAADKSLHKPHVKHRCFSEWVEKNLPQWKLSKRVPNKYPPEDEVWSGPLADFFVYERLHD